MDFETKCMPCAMKSLLMYKFDPMDFETNVSNIVLEFKNWYKFDPMDFETTAFTTDTSLPPSINLILWILKR